MDPSALESVSRRLEASLDCWGAWILVATGVVVLGLLIEYWEPVRDFFEEYRRPAAAFPWKKFMGLTGGILVTVGVVGELGFTYKASRVETKLRENNHKIEESLNRKSGDAKVSAEGAASAASRATISAGKAGIAADKAQQTVGAVAKQADELLNKYVEAENKRLELEKSLSPREFPFVYNLPKGHDNFDPLKPFAGTNVIIEYLQDAEAVRATTLILRLVHEANWNVVDVKPNPEAAINNFFDGVVVYAPNGVPRLNPKETVEGKRLEDAANAVIGFLGTYDWAARKVPSKLHEFGLNTIKISIGFKPSPYFQTRELRKLMEEIERNKKH